MWPINYSSINLYTQGLGNICVKFPLELSSRSGEEDFFNRFYGKSNMAAKWCDLWCHTGDNTLSFGEGKKQYSNSSVVNPYWTNTSPNQHANNQWNKLQDDSTTRLKVISAHKYAYSHCSHLDFSFYHYNNINNIFIILLMQSNIVVMSHQKCKIIGIIPFWTNIY